MTLFSIYYLNVEIKMKYKHAQKMITFSAHYCCSLLMVPVKVRTFPTTFQLNLPPHTTCRSPDRKLYGREPLDQIIHRKSVPELMLLYMYIL